MEDDAAFWAPFFHGPGVAGSSHRVSALRVVGGRLVVAGSFTAAGPFHTWNVATWSGDAWEPLGAGLRRDPGGGVGSVLSLAEYQGHLDVGGAFTGSGTTQLRNIALWDGNRWQPLGSGLNATVLSLAAFGNDLVAAGAVFDGLVSTAYLAAWDGTIWRSLGAEPRLEVLRGEAGAARSSPSPRIEVMVVYGTSLYVAGVFTHIGSTPACNIARWENGVWLPVGGGLDGAVHTLHVQDGFLYAGGEFHHAGDIAAESVSRWDGRSWSTLGERPLPWWDAHVRSMTTHEGELVLAGQFRIGAGEFPLLGWDGKRWRRLEANFGVSAVASYGGRLYAGGSFLTTEARRLGNIARWSDTGWEALQPGGGLESLPKVTDHGDFAFIQERRYEVRALAASRDELIAAGQFDWAGQTRATSVARWDGASWHALGAGIAGTVHALADFAGELVAAGEFAVAGGVPASNIAAWDGTRWRPLGDGITGGSVSALAVFEGKLVAAGRFTRAGGRIAYGVAAWDGEGWSRIGFGLFAAPKQLLVHRGQLYAAGDLRWTGYLWLQGVARWDGQEWTPLGSLPSGTEYVGSLAAFRDGIVAAVGEQLYSWDGQSWSSLSPPGFWIQTMAEHDGMLFVSGATVDASGVGHSELARWDGSAWRPVGTGVDQNVYAFSSLGGSLFLGGRFTRAGPYSSLGIARWDGEDVPVEVEPVALALESAFRTALHVPTLSAGGAIPIRYTIATTRAPVRLVVLDVRGRVVRVLEDGWLSTGMYSSTWDGRNRSGVAAARGVYFVNLRAGDEALTRKHVLLR